MPENVQNKICTCKNVKGEKSSERKLRDPMNTGRPSVLLLTRHAFTINPCCEYGEERQVTGNKTITDNLLHEAGVCECVCGVSGTDKHLFLSFFFFSSIKWQWRKVCEKREVLNICLQQIHIVWMTSPCRRTLCVAPCVICCIYTETSQSLLQPWCWNMCISGADVLISV